MSAFAAHTDTTVRTVFEGEDLQSQGLFQLSAAVTVFKSLVRTGVPPPATLASLRMFDEDAGALAAQAGEEARGVWWVLQQALQGGVLAHALSVAFGGDPSALDDASWGALRAEWTAELRSGGAIPVSRREAGGPWMLAPRSSPPQDCDPRDADAYWKPGAGESRRLTFEALAFPITQSGAFAPRCYSDGESAEGHEAKRGWHLEPAQGWCVPGVERTHILLCPLMGGVAPAPVWHLAPPGRVRARERDTLQSLAALKVENTGVRVDGAPGAWCVWELPARRSLNDGWPYVVGLQVLAAVRDDLVRRPRDAHPGVAGEAWALDGDPHLSPAWNSRVSAGAGVVDEVRRTLLSLASPTAAAGTLAAVVEGDEAWSSAVATSSVSRVRGNAPLRPLLVDGVGDESGASRISFLRERALSLSSSAAQSLLRVGASLSEAYAMRDVTTIRTLLRGLAPCWFRMLASLFDSSGRLVPSGAPLHKLPSYAQGWADRAHGMLPLTLLLARLGYGRASHVGLARAILETIRRTPRYRNDTTTVHAHLREVDSIIRDTPPSLAMPGCRTMWTNEWCVWSSPSALAAQPSASSSSSSSSSAASTRSDTTGAASDAVYTMYGRMLDPPVPPPTFVRAHVEDPVLMARVRCSLVCGRCSVPTHRRSSRDPEVRGVPLSSPIQFMRAGPTMQEPSQSSSSSSSSSACAKGIEW